MNGRRILIGIIIAGWLVAGCKENVVSPADQELTTRGVPVQLTAGLHIDSAQVLFFKNTLSTDSLILREIIYDIGTQPSRFDFNLPAGNYIMAIFGNVPTNRLVQRPPYSRDSIWFSFQGGEQPPVVYYGLIGLNAGVDTLRASGMILLVSQVELTIRNIPEGIDRIEVRLQNTSSGISLNGYLSENMNPPLSETLSDIRKDSVYVVSMNCFPSGNNQKSQIDVFGYSASGTLVYSGQSVPFTVKASKRMIITCSFEHTPASRAQEIGKIQEQIDGFTLQWRLDDDEAYR